MLSQRRRFLAGKLLIKTKALGCALNTPLKFMTLIKTSNREEAYRALINVYLKDNHKYCNFCGETYVKEFMPCCEDPQIGTHADHAKAVAAQCALLRGTRANKHASNKDKSMRFGISLPPWMYNLLDNYEKLYGRRLISTDKDIIWLAKTFKQFAIPRKL